MPERPAGSWVLGEAPLLGEPFPVTVRLSIGFTARLGLPPRDVAMVQRHYRPVLRHLLGTLGCVQAEETLEAGERGFTKRPWADGFRSQVKPYSGHHPKTALMSLSWLGNHRWWRRGGPPGKNPP